MLTLRMREALSRCANCELLAVEDLPISNAAKDVPAALERLHRQFGKRWTHVLAINDIYLDSMHFPLQGLGRRDIVGPDPEDDGMVHDLAVAGQELAAGEVHPIGQVGVEQEAPVLVGSAPRRYRRERARHADDLKVLAGPKRRGWRSTGGPGIDDLCHRG